MDAPGAAPHPRGPLDRPYHQQPTVRLPPTILHSHGSGGQGPGGWAAQPTPHCSRSSVAGSGRAFGLPSIHTNTHTHEYLSIEEETDGGGERQCSPETVGRKGCLGYMQGRLQDRRGYLAHIVHAHISPHIIHTHIVHTRARTHRGEGRRKLMGERRGGNKRDGVSVQGVAGDLCKYVDNIFISAIVKL